MNHIITPAGKLRQITNLRPILTLASKVNVKKITITRKPEGKALLVIEFEDLSIARSDFESFNVCKSFVENPQRAWWSQPNLDYEIK